MSHSYVKCWIHALWATKRRELLIKESMEELLYAQIKHELIEAGCFALIVNGMPDHVHCLFSINPKKSISETIGQVKGLSSHWVNERPLLPYKFAWQTGFAAYSVSESQLPKVLNYIKNQKEHHKIKTLEEEFKKLLRLHGLHKNNPGLFWVS